VVTEFPHPREIERVHATIPIAADKPASSFARRLAEAGEANFAWILAALVLLSGCIRLLILREFWTENPFATLPTLDSALYWQRAGEIAAGHWMNGEPFHIAPLYTVSLGLFRALGGDLLGLYFLQTLAHLATAVAIAAAARVRFGGAAGCIAAALFLGLAEPALFATRVLGTTLQILLVAVLWWDWARLSLDPEPPVVHVIRIGGWIALLALAFPAAIVLIPVYFVWLASAAGDEGGSIRIRRAIVGTAAALLVVAPATIHNAMATGEFIPITSHAGITLAAGNGAGSVGIFTPIAETSGTVASQAQESARAFERATGRRGSWREIDAHFRNGVFDWWWRNPVDALSLFGRKAWWFLTSRHYDNVTAFALEREYGLQDASAGLILETPFLFGLAFVGFAATVRRRRRFVPELALAGLSLVVCVAFMYSARYRALAIPVLCGLAASSLVNWDRLRWRRPLAAFAVLLPLPLLGWNAITGFGSIDFMREDFTELLSSRYVASGLEHHQRGDLEAAETQLRRAATLSMDTTGATDATRALASFYLDSDRVPQARAAALEVVRRDPTDEAAHRMLYDSQIKASDYRNARVTLDLIEQLAPRDASIQVAMAWFYASCPDLGLRNPSRALHHAAAAERLVGSSDPEVDMAMTLAAASAGDFPRAIAAARRGLATASERNDDDLAGEFEKLLRHLENRNAIAAQPRLLAGR